MWHPIRPYALLLAAPLAGCSERLHSYRGELDACGPGWIAIHSYCLNMPAVGGIVSLLVLIWMMRLIVRTHDAVARIEKKLNAKKD